MKAQLNEKGVETLIFGILALGLAIVVLLLLYFLAVLFTPFIVPVVLLFFKKMNKLLIGSIGIVLFAYYVIDLHIGLPPSDTLFLGNNPLLGKEALFYVNLLNYTGLAISIFMVYLFIDNKRFR